jgi:hypothetical protein
MIGENAAELETPIAKRPCSPRLIDRTASTASSIWKRNELVLS